MPTSLHFTSRSSLNLSLEALPVVTWGCRSLEARMVGAMVVVLDLETLVLRSTFSGAHGLRPSSLLAPARISGPDQSLSRRDPAGKDKQTLCSIVFDHFGSPYHPFHTLMFNEIR